MSSLNPSYPDRRPGRRAATRPVGRSWPKPKRQQPVDVCSKSSGSCVLSRERGPFFSDHDRGRCCIPRRYRWHDGGIHDPDVAETPEPQPLVHRQAETITVDLEGFARRDVLHDEVGKAVIGGAGAGTGSTPLTVRTPRDGRPKRLAVEHGAGNETATCARIDAAAIRVVGGRLAGTTPQGAQCSADEDRLDKPRNGGP